MGRHVNPASVFSTALLERAVGDALSLVDAGRLLDVGCGDKPYAGVAGAAWHVGLDVRSGDVRGRADALPFADSAFDVVLATEVVEHVPDPDAMVGELRRVLRPGGTLVLSSPFVHELHEAPHDYQRFTVFGLRHLLRDFEMVSEVAVGGGGAVIVDHVVRAADRVAGRVLRRLRAAALRRWLTGWPQRAAAQVALRRGAVRTLTGRQPDGPALTLGYVVVARSRKQGR